MCQIHTMKKTVKYTGKGRPGFTPQRREKFLAFLRAAPNVAAAADSVGLSRRCAYDTRARDPEFASAWDEAVETGVDALEAEAYRRAVHGTDRPVFYQGAECGVVREYSDTLVIFLLKSRRKEIFGDRLDTQLSGIPDTLTIRWAIEPEQEGE